ncbi:acetylornithine transaminase [Streptomyces malaysiense]|uniref:Acetylornithine aminotransferase n=1 Tax=Streptomyces malaysiense TaxID=1428626 RepID=A0A1J4PTZ0_9ACTN|nr:acetylornithine transaminase [Streptomyces malaysiense]OIK23582.1 acetylornithine aminotransferase [Streptomyces malaysiense]
MMSNYGTPRTALTRGSGTRYWDADGNTYLDFVGGIAVNALGSAHPAVVDAVTRQIGRLGHVSNLYISEPPLRLAEALQRLTGRMARAFLCNSGAEANEAAFKMARLTGRGEIVAADGSFHGRTMGALALTGQPAKRRAFEPLPGGVRHVPFGDVQALGEAVSERTAMVILEPLQGEGGVVVPPAGYLRAAREITRATGTLLALDEVQTGVGRTGYWFAHQADDVEPDILTLGKALGGGLPIGAALAFGEAAELLGPGSHGSTFGGNPVACAAALAVLETIEQDDLLRAAHLRGEQLRAGLGEIGDPRIAEVRGRGLLLAIALTGPHAKAVEDALAAEGVLVNAIAPDVIRIAPPLTVTEGEVRIFLRAVSTVLHGMTDGQAA